MTRLKLAETHDFSRTILYPYISENNYPAVSKNNTHPYPGKVIGNFEGERDGVEKP